MIDAKCPYCGRVISSRNDYRPPPWCPHCGADLNQKPAPATPPPESGVRSRSPAPIPPKKMAEDLIEPLVEPLDEGRADERRPAASSHIASQPSRQRPEIDEEPPSRRRSSHRRRSDRDYDDRIARITEPEQPPFMVVRATYHFRTNRNYRVYIHNDELLFIETGQGDADTMVWQGYMLGGIIGGLIGSMMADDARKKAIQRRRELEEADTEDLLDIAEQGGVNFRATAGDFTKASIEPRSLWHTINFTTNTYEGLLIFQHYKRGKFTLELTTKDDMRMALEMLPPILGELLQINVEWDKRKGRYVKV